MVTDGYQLLDELGAVDDARELTQSGRELAKLPLDPRIGRMILAARDGHCLREMLVIAAALSVQDPRERPQEQAGTADQAHAKWRGDEQQQRSEFLAWLNLWKAFDAEWTHESQRKQRDWCRRNFLSYLRMREWREVHAQLHTLCGEHSWRENDKPATYDQIHKALLAGLLGNVGLKSEEEGHYLGARGIRFWPHPGSALAKKAGKWIVAAELVETTRLFARCLARIEPEWLEEAGAHLVKRHVFEPHWEKRTGQVRAWERGTLHGLMLYARRPVSYSRIDPALCRELFIREGLVQGELPDDLARRARFFQHNQKLVRDIEHLEHKSRRPDVLVDEELIYAFYDSKLPAQVVDAASFEAWRNKAEQDKPKLLFLEREQLMRHEAAGITSERFPGALEVHGMRHALSYHFEPGATDDGVTLTVPLAALNQIPAVRCEWLVPGMLEQKVLQLAKTLPQKYRHRLQPLDEFAAGFAAAAHDRDEPLLRALTRAIEERLAMKLPMDAFRPEMLPPHLSMNFRVIDEHGRMLEQSRSLGELKSRLGGKVEQVFAAVEASETAGELSGLTAWSFGEIPELLEMSVGGRMVVGFPALADEGDTVALRAFDTPEKAAAAHRAGLRRLFALELREQVKYIEKSLPGLRDMALAFMPLGTEAELKAQLVAATLERTCMMEPLPRNAEEFARRKEEGRSRIALVAQEIARLAGAILAEHAALLKKLVPLKAFPAAVEDIKAQCAQLLQRNFVAATPFERLQHFPRYLKAAALRIDKLRADPARDERLARDFAALARPFERERATMLKTGASDPALEEFRWLLEELRVALFAQELRTPSPVSVKRLQKAWESRQRH
jgi:ATP-dependent helicase HrpA